MAVSVNCDGIWTEHWDYQYLNEKHILCAGK